MGIGMDMGMGTDCRRIGSAVIEGGGTAGGSGVGSGEGESCCRDPTVSLRLFLGCFVAESGCGETCVQRLRIFAPCGQGRDESRRVLCKGGTWIEGQDKRV